MYPAAELKRLELRKAMLQLRIAERRLHCAQAGVELARPLSLVDRGIELWRRVPPIAKAVAVPALLILARRLSRRDGFIGSIARLAPAVLGAARMVGGRHASV